MSKKYYPFISGLKGIACIGVMIGHFFGLFRFMESAPFDYATITDFILSPFGVILDANFWLYLFFVSSGFLLAQSSVRTAADLFRLCFKRVLRLSFPVLFSSMAIYLLLTLFGSANQNTSIFFINGWYQNSYLNDVSFLSVLRSPFDVLFMGNAAINAPFWVLHNMLLASVIIYVVLYLIHKLERFPYSRYFVYYSVLILMLNQSSILISCYLGMGILIHQPLIQKMLPRLRWVCTIPLLLFYYAYGFTQHFAFALLFFLTFVSIIPYFPKVAHVLSTSIPLQLNRISFGVYALHWPVLCTAVAFLLVHVIPTCGIIGALVAGFLLYILLTILLSWVFSVSAEPAAKTLVTFFSDTLFRSILPKQID